MLKIRGLTVVFSNRRRSLTAVENFDLDMKEGEIVGLVGESGAGKSVTAHAIMGLIRDKSAKVSGSVEFEGADLLKLSGGELRKYQGKELSMIFQEPMTSLNPTMRVGKQVEETLLIHTDLNAEGRKKAALEAMALAGLNDPEALYRSWPHELSGGMRQRVMIASAIALRPKLLIADEPTTALDVTTQRKILDTLRDINRRSGMAILFISHDLGVIKSICERVAVMKDGRTVETGPAEQIFHAPREDYTKLLISSRPVRKKLKGADEA